MFVVFRGGKYEKNPFSGVSHLRCTLILQNVAKTIIQNQPTCVNTVSTKITPTYNLAGTCNPLTATFCELEVRD